jgi:O-acetyl-ADP-ribose deacetylase (regulator of RNase III)
MIGQHGIRSPKAGPPIRYAAVEQCLSQVANKALELSATIHMPRISTGLAGGTWSEIEPLIGRQLCQRGLEVYVYDLA